MQRKIILKVEDIRYLTEIRQSLDTGQFLSTEQLHFLNHFLNGLPEPDTILAHGANFSEGLEIELWDIKHVRPQLDKWVELFKKLPMCVDCRILSSTCDDDWKLMQDKNIISMLFLPSVAHKEADNYFQLNLRTDGSARFVLPGEEGYPELLAFAGNWKEAYLLLIKTLKEGWPQAIFSKELE